MKTQKVQLINAPILEGYIGSSRSGILAPLNLITLATYIKEQLPGVEIEILDGDILSQESILRRIDADIVGISPNILTYNNSLEIAKYSKKKGSKVVFGGIHSSAMPEKILRNRFYVDAVIVGNGEEAFYRYIKGEPLSKINNLVYRNNGEIKKNSVSLLNLNKLPYPDFKFLNLEPYFSNYAKKFGFTSFYKAIPIYSQKGCPWKEKTGGCIFCSVERTNRFKNPQRVWNEIESVINDYKADIIYNVSDDMINNRYWLGEFAKFKPKYINCALFLYGRINYIDLEIARLLREINCYEILAGIESGNDKCLKALRKGFKIEDVLSGNKILRKFSIKLFPCFVLGAPGETIKSALDTLELAKKLVDMGNVYEISCSTLLPIPGSIAFNMIMQIPSLQTKYGYQDILSPEDLRRDWVNYFTKVRYDSLLEITNRILDLVPIKNNFARLASPRASEKIEHISKNVISNNP